MTSILITARLDAIEGKSTWRMPLPTGQPTLLDIVTQGYALITYDGSRHPRFAQCAGCHKVTHHAWRVWPIDFAIPACSASHAANRIEQIWTSTTDQGGIYIRVMGDRAARMAGLEKAA